MKNLALTWSKSEQKATSHILDSDQTLLHELLKHDYSDEAVKHLTSVLSEIVSYVMSLDEVKIKDLVLSLCASSETQMLRHFINMLLFSLDAKITFSIMKVILLNRNAAGSQVMYSLFMQVLSIDQKHKCLDEVVLAENAMKKNKVYNSDVGDQGLYIVVQNTDSDAGNYQWPLENNDMYNSVQS
ncbi:MAG: hypothetical protein HAW62_00125 [Endozoicomonadaceae bacterium]|nr:hypothetical protein [Endozoicomonadaceae bacterium]